MLTIRYVPFVGFYGESQKNYREQAGFSVFGDVVRIRITEDSPEIKVLQEKGLVVCQDCPQESV